MEELLLAIKQSKPGKRGGKDRLPNKFWKSLKGKGLEELLSFFNQCWDSESSPEQWKLAQVVGVFKKGAADDPVNYRPISLLQTCHKLYARIVANRLSAGLDAHIRELQYGFRPNLLNQTVARPSGCETTPGTVPHVFGLEYSF